MRRILTLAFVIAMFSSWAFAQGKQYQIAGVAFYNLENLFDTIP